MLTQGNKENKVEAVDWSWNDWKYQDGPKCAKQNNQWKNEFWLISFYSTKISMIIKFNGNSDKGSFKD